MQYIAVYIGGGGKNDCVSLPAKTKLEALNNLELEIEVSDYTRVRVYSVTAVAHVERVPAVYQLGSSKEL